MKFFSPLSLLTLLGLANFVVGEELLSIYFPEGNTCPYSDACVEYAFSAMRSSYNYIYAFYGTRTGGYRGRELEGSEESGGLRGRTLQSPSCAGCASSPGGGIACSMFPWCSRRRLAPKKDHKGKPTTTTATTTTVATTTAATTEATSTTKTDATIGSTGTDPINSYMVDPETSELFAIYNSCPPIKSADTASLYGSVFASVTSISGDTNTDGMRIEYRNCD